jgi:hypothetical protein
LHADQGERTIAPCDARRRTIVAIAQRGAFDWLARVVDEAPADRVGRIERRNDGDDRICAR